MPGRVGVHPEVRRRLRQQSRAQLEHLRFDRVDVGDHEVDVELLRECRVGPPRWLVVRGELEAQLRAVAVPDVDPVAVLAGNRQPKELLVEQGQ